MPNLPHFLRLAAYEAWANRHALEMLRATPEAGERARRVFAHALIAPQVWLCRIEGRPYPSADFWPDLDLERCAVELEHTAAELGRFLASLTPPDLERVVAYSNSKGDAFETPIGEILHHLFAHGPYHRGQIAAQVRAAGGTPLNTDYIVFSRGR